MVSLKKVEIELLEWAYSLKHRVIVSLGHH